MNFYEELQEEACGNGVDVCDYPFSSDRIKGLYCDGTIAINKALTDTQKACVLAEELGQHRRHPRSVRSGAPQAGTPRKTLGLQSRSRSLRHHPRLPEALPQPA